MDQEKVLLALTAASAEDGAEAEHYWAGKFLTLLESEWIDILPYKEDEDMFYVRVNVSKMVSEDDGKLSFDNEKLIYAASIAARIFYNYNTDTGKRGAIDLFGWDELEEALGVDGEDLSVSRLGMDIINLVVETLATTVNVLTENDSEWTAEIDS